MLGKRDAEATPIDVAGKTPDGVLAVFPEGIQAGSHQRLVYSQDHEVIAAPSGDFLGLIYPESGQPPLAGKAATISPSVPHFPRLPPPVWGGQTG